MAEFVDVMEQRKRMCKPSKCKECPLYFHNNGESVQCDMIIFKCPTTAEKIIMDWAKEHPEPKVKTMAQVVLERFPMADVVFQGNLNQFGTVCPRSFGFEDDKNCCNKRYTCEDCWNRPAPEEYQDKEAKQE